MSAAPSATTPAGTPQAAAAEEPRKPQRWSRAADEALKKQFLKEVRDQCRPELDAFAQCAKSANFKVAWQCREHNRTANACLHQYSKDELWEEYKRDKKRAWIEQGILRKDTPL
jgi:COX assembly protein 1